MSVETLRKNSKSFYFAGRFLGQAALTKVAALYSVCRELDDLADLSSDLERSRVNLERIEKALRFESSNSQKYINIDLESLGINTEHLANLVKGLVLDTERVDIVTEDELLTYCYLVAGTVGLMFCDLFEIKDDQAKAHAIDLGIAMQLTNIARDVVEDAKLGRKYIPTEYMMGVSSKTLITPAPHEIKKIKGAVSKLLRLADIYYKSGFRGLAFLPLRIRFVVFVAGRVYRRIGLKLERRQFDIWQGRCFVSLLEKSLDCFLGLFNFIFIRENHFYSGTHAQTLHTSFCTLPGADNQRK